MSLASKVRNSKIPNNPIDYDMKALVDAYVDLYGWDEIGMTDEDILEEILADAYGGIDIFAGHTYEGATRFTEAVKGAVETEEHRGKKNTAVDQGSGGAKFSRDAAYQYENLIKKPDMQITVVDDSQKYQTNKTGRDTVVDIAIQNAKKIGKINENGNVFVHVKDTDTDVMLSRAGLSHSLDRRFNRLASITENAGEILQNSIKINELTPKIESASNSYVLLGAAKNKIGEPFIVEFVVNKFSNELESVDILYSANAKKESAATKAPESTGNPLLITDSSVSIAQLLDYASVYFPDILPESVLRHYGFESRPNGKLGESALFSREVSTEDLEKIQEKLTRVRQQLYAKRKQAAYWKAEATEKHEGRARPGDVGAAANDVVTEFNSTLEAVDISDRMQKLADGIVSGKMNPNRAVDLAMDIAGDIVWHKKAIKGSHIGKMQFFLYYWDSVWYNSISELLQTEKENTMENWYDEALKLKAMLDSSKDRGEILSQVCILENALRELKVELESAPDQAAALGTQFHAANRPAVITTKGITKIYGNHRANDDVSITVKKGSIYGLVGRNGAGKTTWMKIVLGLTKANRGTVSMAGGKLKEVRSRIGYLIENPSFYDSLTAYENLMYRAKIIDLKESEKSIDEALEKVGLLSKKDDKLKTFSLGQRQMLGIACAILGDPEILVLDEPVNGLDPVAIVSVRNLLLEMNRNGVTIIISSHILGELQKLATCYGFIVRGKLVKELSEEELMNNDIPIEDLFVQLAGGEQA